MKKPSESQQKTADTAGCPDEVWVKKYPTIVEYLVTTTWEEGGDREPSSLAITVKDGLLQAALNDKALKQSLYTSAGSLPEALKLMEAALVDGTGVWRSWKGGKKK